MVPWNSSRTKVQIKLSIQRLRTLQEKKHALAKKSRREIADLLLKNRVETARLRVEGLIADDIYVELLELLELYCELLQARFNLLDASAGTEPEASISEAVCAVVYAAPRTELKELQVLREMLMHKYGRAFSLTLLPTEPAPPTVPARVTSKLALFTPGKELVDAYLYEIAKGYGVDWVPEPSFSADKESEVEEKAADKGKSNEKPDGGADGSGSDDGGPAIGERVKEPVAVAEKDPSPAKKDTALPEVPHYPSGQEEDAWASSTPSTAPAAPVTSSRKLTEEEELAQRFERLKNLR